VNPDAVDLHRRLLEHVARQPHPKAGGRLGAVDLEEELMHLHPPGPVVLVDDAEIEADVVRSPGVEVERFAWSSLALRLEALEAQLLGTRFQPPAGPH
jgi:hypothetical protein